MSFGSIAAFLVFFTVEAVISSDIYVDVEGGTLLGQTLDFVEEDILNISVPVDVFLGVPYAEPPERFRPPQPKSSWDGVWNATHFRGTCVQRPNFPGIDESFPTEDCLFLNVFAPNNSVENLPVMVFIHGGSYVSGTSMQRDTSGIPMAAIGNVVVVTINYRLGVLGFLDTGDDASSGNYGLLDQAEALRWVRRNIEAFGGDSANVTIFGESAGAGSVHFHMLSKTSRDLFDRAILQSGTAVAPWSFRQDLEDQKVNEAFRIGEAMGCNTRSTNMLVDCLRQVDAQTLENTAEAIFVRLGPTIDGVFLQESPLELVKRGDFKQCPLTVGFNRDEGTLFLVIQFFSLALEDRPHIDYELFKETFVASLNENNGNVGDLLISAVAQQYVDWSQAGNDSYDYFQTVSLINGDEIFSCPAMLVARSHAKMSSEPVYLYFMTHVPTSSVATFSGVGPTWLGAGHGEDLRFVFGYSFIPGLSEFRGPMTAEEDELSVKVIRFWTNFAKTGDPSRESFSSPPGSGELTWPAFSITDQYYKELSLDLPVGRGLKANECAFWNDFKPLLQQYLATLDELEVRWRDEFGSWQDDLREWRDSFREFQRQKPCL